MNAWDHDRPVGLSLGYTPPMTLVMGVANSGSQNLFKAQKRGRYHVSCAVRSRGTQADGREGAAI